MWGSDWEMCTGRVYLSTFEVTFWKAQSLRDKGCIQKMMSHQTKKIRAFGFTSSFFQPKFYS